MPETRPGDCQGSLAIYKPSFFHTIPDSGSLVCLEAEQQALALARGPDLGEPRVFGVILFLR